MAKKQLTRFGEDGDDGMSDLIDRCNLRLMRTEECAGHTIEYALGWKACIEWMKTLPSAQPEQKVGKWIKMSDADGVYYCCSECGEDLYREWSFDRNYDLFPRKKTIDKTKYCPNCGAKMEEQDG